MSQLVTLTKTVAASGTPEELATSSIHLVAPILFIGQKGYDVANTGTVHIQVKDPDGTFRDAIKLTAGAEREWPVSGFVFANEFKIRVETNGDGVRVVSFKI
jgi:hypothetical protein